MKYTDINLFPDKKLFLLLDDDAFEYRIFDSFEDAKRGLIDWLSYELEDEDRDAIMAAADIDDDIFYGIYDEYSCTIVRASHFKRVGKEA